MERRVRERQIDTLGADGNGIFCIFIAAGIEFVLWTSPYIPHVHIYTPQLLILFIVLGSIPTTYHFTKNSRRLVLEIESPEEVARRLGRKMFRTGALVTCIGLFLAGWTWYFDHYRYDYTIAMIFLFLPFPLLLFGISAYVFGFIPVDIQRPLEESDVPG